MKKIFFTLLVTAFFFISVGTTQAGEVFRQYLNDNLPIVITQISQGKFDPVFTEIKIMLNNGKLKREEKLYILDKCFEQAKNLGYYSEGGELYELAYSVEGIDKKLAQDIHTKLSQFYENARFWRKAINTHFYYLQNIKVDDKEKKQVLFEIVQNYINLLQFKKAERVLGEILKLASEDRDFAYVFYYQAVCNFSQNNYKEALRFYDKALSFDMLENIEKGRAYYNMGLCYEINNEIRNAISYYKKASEFYDNEVVISKRLERLKQKAPTAYNEIMNEKNES